MKPNIVPTVAHHLPRRKAADPPPFPLSSARPFVNRPQIHAGVGIPALRSPFAIRYSPLAASRRAQGSRVVERDDVRFYSIFAVCTNRATDFTSTDFTDFHGLFPLALICAICVIRVICGSCPPISCPQISHPQISPIFTDCSLRLSSVQSVQSV